MPSKILIDDSRIHGDWIHDIINLSQEPFSLAEPTYLLSEHSGAMVALHIPEEVGKKLALPDGISAKEMHVTLVYLGETKKLGSAKSGHYGHRGVPGRRGGSAPSGYNSPFVTYPASMENMEAGLVELETEQAVISDPVTKKAIYHAAGAEKVSIKLTKEEWEIAQGKILVHNHPPGGSPGPSPSDVLAHTKHGVQEMRVVQMDKQGDRWLFTMTANKGSQPWVEDFKGLQSFIKEEAAKRMGIFVKAIDSGKMTGEQANHEHWHEVWKVVSQRYNFDYERVRME